MRIAQVITLFLPDFVGGATLVCARMARELAARGHEIEVFCGRPDADAPQYGEHRWQVNRIPVTGVACAAGYDQLAAHNYRHPEVTPVFERFLDRTRPDVVHFHSIQALGATLLEAAAARGIPIVVTMHDWWWFCVRLFLVDPEGFVCPPRVASGRCHCAPGFDFVTRRRYLDAALARADRVLTPSRFLAEAAIANGVGRERVEVCPNGVEVPPWNGRRRAGPVRFGYFGGPDNRLKGLPTLLAAAGALDVGGWELVLYGVEAVRWARTPGLAGAARAALPARLLTDRAGNTLTLPATIGDRVRPAAAFPPHALADVLGALDCLVVPSLMRESYSLATREALAAGVPVIASDSGGPGEIIRPGVNGLVFATGDPDDLATQLRRVVLDPELLERLRAGAVATAVPEVAEQAAHLERIYAAAAGGHHLPAAVQAPPVATHAAPPANAVSARGPRAGDAPPGIRHVLFVTGIDGAPLRYRVINLQDQLDTAGITSRVLYFTDPAIAGALAAADLVVVYRVPMGGYVRAWLAEARRLGRPLVFSCDDLVFDPAATPHAALALLAENQRAAWHAYTERYAATLRACDAFIGTTEPLVAVAARAGVPGFVVPNGLGRAQLAAAEEAYKRTQRPAAAARGAEPPASGRSDGTLRVAYASGTIMHDLDFTVVEPALAAVLRVLPRVVLRLIGYLRIGPALAPFADRIERIPFVPWRQLCERLADVDVNLAPLVAPDAFSDAKSAAKYLEAAVLGVPTLATPTAAFRGAIRDGENGILAASTSEWHDALVRVLGDGGLRRRLGNAARDDVFLRCTPAAQAAGTLAVLRRAWDVGASAAATARVAPPTERAAGPAASPGEPAMPTDAATLARAYPGEVGRYDFEPEDAGAGTAQLSRDTPSPFLLPGRTVGQTFTAAGDGLYRIDLCVGSDGRRTPHRLVLHLGERPGSADLRRAELDAGVIAADAWVAMEFAPLRESAGRSLYCWVEAEGAAERTAVTLWTYTRGWGETVPSGLHIDHRPARGSLAFRTFHRASGSPHRSPCGARIVGA